MLDLIWRHYVKLRRDADDVPLSYDSHSVKKDSDICTHPLEVELSIILEIICKHKLTDNIKDLLYCSVGIPHPVNLSHHQFCTQKQVVDGLRIKDDLRLLDLAFHLSYFKVFRFSHKCYKRKRGQGC